MMVVAMFGYPYSGDVHVPSWPFEADLKIFDFELAKLGEKTKVNAPAPSKGASSTSQIR